MPWALAQALLAPEASGPVGIHLSDVIWGKQSTAVPLGQAAFPGHPLPLTSLSIATQKPQSLAQGSRLGSQLP